MGQHDKLNRKSLILGAGVAALLVVMASDLMFEKKMPTQKAEVETTHDKSSEQKSLTDQNLIEIPSDSENILAYKSQYGALPDTLQGTLMRSSLQVDEQGNLRVSSDIKRVFDYFLSTVEEEDLDIILARIDEYLDYYLQEPALSQSKQILAQYIDLKQALYDFELSRSDSLKALIDSGELMADKSRYLKLLKEQMAAQQALREQYLDPEVHEAFFASEEAYDQYSLSRLLVESDAELSDEEKAARLAQIDAEAPIEIVEARREASITDDLNARVEQVKQRGGGEKEIRAVRVEMFGEEAAERFDVLDQERAQWKERLNNYLRQRQDILLMEGLSIEERQAQVDTLRASQFDSREQIRVKVYERKEDA